MVMALPRTDFGKRMGSKVGPKSCANPLKPRARRARPNRIARSTPDIKTSDCPFLDGLPQFWHKDCFCPVSDRGGPPKAIEHVHGLAFWSGRGCPLCHPSRGRTDMATRDDKDQNKAADEAARTARTVTDEAARVGEQSARAGADMARRS